MDDEDDYREDGILNGLRDCLLQLIQGKLAEKRRQVEKLKLLLKRDDILKSLDGNSSKKRSELGTYKPITWTKVFTSVRSFIEQEAERLKEKESSTEKPSQIVIANRNKDKKFCSDIFKYIVNVIGSRSSSILSCGVCVKILDHFRAVISNQFALSAFGLDYTNVLLKEILQVQSMCQEISCDVYKELLLKYSEFIRRPPAGWDRNILAHVFYQLLSSAYVQYDVKPQFLFEFFGEIFSVKCEKASRFHEHLLQSLLLMCHSVSLCSRVQLCALGESIILPLVHLWKKPTDSAKERMLEFMLVQLALHHPQGAVKEENGAFAVDWSKWKSVLMNLYQLVIRELVDVCGKNKYSSSKELVLHPYFISVAAKVCAQVFQEPCHGIEVSQLPATLEISGTASKRRRIDVGFRAFISEMQSFSSSDVVPWLQVISELFRSHYNIITLEEIALVISSLIEMHLSCDQIEVKTHLLIACQTAVDAFCLLQENCTVEHEVVTCDWSRLWELSIKSVALMHQCHEAGHRLLATLLKYKLVVPKNEFLNLYIPGSNNGVTVASLRTLIVYLKKYSLPSASSQPIKPLSNQGDKPLVRHQLLSWICLVPDAGGEPGSLIDLLASSDINALTIQYLAAALPFLCFPDYRCATMEDKTEKVGSKAVGTPSWIEDLEKDLLQCTFDLPLANNCATAKPFSVVSHVESQSAAWKQISEYLLNAASHMSESSLNIQSSSPATIQLKMGCLAFLILKDLCLNSAVFRDEVLDSLVNTIKKFLYAAVEAISQATDSDSVKVHPPEELLPFFSLILSENKWPEGTEPCSLISELYSECLPSNLPDALINIICMDDDQSQSICDSTVAGWKVKNDAVGEVTVLKPKPKKNRYDSPSKSCIDDFDDDADIADDGCAVANGEEQSFSTPRAKLQMKCVDILASVFQLASYRNGVFGLQVHSTVKKLLQVVKLRKDCKKVENIETVLKLLGCAVRAKHLDEEDIQTVVSIMKTLLNRHSKFRSICTNIIAIFNDLYPHLCSSDANSVLSEKGHVLYMLRVLWSKEEEGKNNQDVALSLAVTLTHLIECDPNAQWYHSKPGTGKELVLVARDYAELLYSRHFRVSLHAASKISCVLQASYASEGAKGQKRMFEELYSKFLQIRLNNDIQNDVHQNCVKDKDRNHAACMLWFLCYSYMNCSPCQKQVVFAICQLVRNGHVHSELAVKVLRQLASFDGHSSLRDLMEPHFDYISYEWIKNKYSIAELPLMLFEFYNLENLLMNFYSRLVPHFVYQLDIASVKLVASKLDMDLTSILVKCLPQMLARIYSWLAEGVCTEKAVQCLQLLEKCVTKEVISKTLQLNMDNIVISLLSMVDGEPEAFVERNEDIGYCPDCISPDHFLSTVDLLKKKAECKKSLVAFLCKKRDGLQNILLFMNVRLCKACGINEVKQSILMYQLFIELLLPDFGSVLKNYHTFLLTELVYALVNFVTERSKTCDGAILAVCIELLQKLCEKSIPLYKEDIGSLLPFLVSRLIPLVSKGKIDQQVISLLTFLVIESGHYLEEHIVSLDPFPDVECLQTLKKKHMQLMYKSGPYSLLMEFDHVIRSFQTTGRSTLEGLRHLHVQLREKKSELQQILTNLQENRLFSEDVKTSSLHQLICTLINLCIPGNAPKEVQVEAGRCLGEIGPVNLSTTVLQTSAHRPECLEERNVQDMPVLDKAYCHVFSLLLPYLKDKRIGVKVVACNVLKNLFRTSAAQQFLIMYGKKYDDWFRYLYPFQSCEKASLCSSSAVYPAKINLVSLWAPDEGSHSEWITNLVCTILESGVTCNAFFEQLTPLCHEEPSFCSQLLPYLIHSVILQGDSHVQGIISDHMSSFFSKLSKYLEVRTSNGSSTPSTQSSHSISFYDCKASVQTMLSVINYLRLQVEPRENSGICSNAWIGLDLDYLHVAQAAQYCSAYFTAILFTELWCDTVRQSTIAPSQSTVSRTESLEECSPDSSPMTILNTQNQDRVALVYKILLEAYINIGDTDGIHGCVEIAADVNSVVCNHYMAEKKWDRLLNYYDQENNRSGVLQALRNCGLDHTLQNYLQSHSFMEAEMSAEEIAYQCECAWKLGQWDLVLPDSEQPQFQESLYKSLQCLYNSNEVGFSRNIDLSRSVLFQNLSHTSLESLRSVLPFLSHLQMLALLEDYSVLATNCERICDIQKKWEDQMSLPYADCEYFEPVSWLQCVILKQHLDIHRNEFHIAKELMKCLEVHAAKAREENHLEAASRAVYLLKNSSFGSPEDKLRWQVEEAKVLWTKQEHLIANRLLKSILYTMEKLVDRNTDDCDLVLSYAKTLSLRGKWLGETCNENSSTIMKDYLEKAINVLENTECLENSSHRFWDAYLAVARYADNQYQSILNYKKSTAYHTKQQLMQNATEAMNRIRTKKNMTMDQKKTLCILQRQHKIDEGELDNLDSDQQLFLMKAISGYLVCLSGTDAHDLWVFRLTALWFQNLDNEKINETIKDRIKSIGSYKFLPLIYQLAARMGTQTSGQFTNVLSQLIKRITIDHPHHALPVILSMSNADKDPSEVWNSGSSSGPLDDEMNKERTIAAEKLVAELKKTRIAHLLRDMSALCDAYISLAYMPADDAVRSREKTAEIPLDQPIMKIRNLSNVPVITEVTKIDRSCSYENIVGIHSFRSEFRICGGVNVPKVIKCIGMDGVEREQLVKGRDDLRQDAVMQQVFSLVNCLLKENNETKKRKLRIRTYKIIPMSRRSGVLQWCVGTQVLSQYLIGSPPQGGAHRKYYPNFWKNVQCQKTMKEISQHSSLQKKREIYDEICKNYPPVFRYFFLENFPEPSAWFERQQSYTKSVAASSIVGYILGLGDRHVNNILIDKYTAEVVHIDFGIAFEKGRILQTPETVPFRLTRDVVDGMGFVGVEGLFKRCCEKTMEVMRNSQDVLLTILEVLLYDPLYDWTVPPAKASLSTSQLRYTAQSSFESMPGVNKLAERALMRLQQKLQGIEEGMTLSVNGHVNLLIQQARDPNNLCRLYAGWQPYL